MSTTSIGRQAETGAAEHFKRLGYKLVDQNWRTKFCEIDLIMTKDRVVYFIEVKYRNSDSFGSGLEYITPKKLKQMKFAAQMWMSSNNYCENAVLAAVELNSSGTVSEMVELP